MPPSSPVEKVVLPCSLLGSIFKTSSVVEFTWLVQRILAPGQSPPAAKGNRRWGARSGALMT